MATSKNGIASLTARGWVSLRQFAIIIGVSYPTAMRMRDKGAVHVVRVGGVNRVYQNELKRFLKEGNAAETSEGEESPSHSSSP